MGVDNRSVVDVFKEGGSKNSTTHGPVVGLLELQVNQGFWLSRRWVTRADNQLADAITRPRSADIVRLQPSVFQRLRAFFGESTVDLIASSENVQKIPRRGRAKGGGCRSFFGTTAKGRWRRISLAKTWPLRRERTYRCSGTVFRPRSSWERLRNT